MSNIDRGAPASVVIGKWPSLAQFCRDSATHGEAIGFPKGLALGTVHRWLVNGHIDAKYHSAILNLARLTGRDLAAIDFVDTRTVAA